LKEGKKKPDLFRLKQFSISHHASTLKVGTDSLLLGAWATSGKRMLDVGTGCGIVALMATQQGDDSSQTDAIDIHEQSVQEANANFKNSPWSHRIKAFHCSIQDFNPGYSYDVILCNPPFFTAGNPSDKHPRAAARHSLTLDIEGLVTHARRLLGGEGSLITILPFDQKENIDNVCSAHGFSFHAGLWFKSKEDKPWSRILTKYVIGKKPEYPIIQHLTHYTENMKWTEAYKALTGDFHVML